MVLTPADKTPCGNRSHHFALFEPMPPAPSMSSKLPSFASRPSPRLGGEAPSNLFELRYATPLVVSVDPLDGAGEGLAERLSLSSQGSCPSLRSFDDGVVRASPAATVLRPRSGREYKVVDRRQLGSDSLSSSPATHSPTYSSVFTYESPSAAQKSPASVSMMSWHSRERCSPCQALSIGPSTPSPRDRTPPTPSSVSVTKDSAPSPQLPGRREPPLPPRKGRACHRAHSEPWSGRTEFHRIVCHTSKSSAPTTPISPLVRAPETVQPSLNYAEIDLSATFTPPPVQPIRHYSRRQKKAPAKPVAIEYTQIDHTATTALKKAGLEHAQSREDNNSLRRGATAMSLVRKNSAPVTSKDKKERKLSTCSMDSI